MNPDQVTEEKISAAIKECEHLITMHDMRAETEARQALQLAISIEHKENIVLAYCAMSSVYNYLHFDNIKSFEYAKLAVSAAEKLSVCFAKVLAENHLANAYLRLRDYTRTLKILSNCREMVNELQHNDVKHDTLRWGIFNTTALVYINIGLFRLAKPFFDLSLEYALRTGDADIIRRSRIAVASHLFRVKEYKLAREKFLELHGEHKELPLHETSAIIYHYMGIIEQDEGNLEAARDLFAKAFAMRKKIGNEMRYVFSYISLGRISVLLNDLPKANEYYTELVALMDKHKNEYTEQQRNEVFFEMYGQLGDYKKSYEHFRKLEISAGDSATIEKTLETLFEIEQQKEQRVRDEAEQLKSLNTEMQQYSKTLESSNKDLKSFAHVTSHDLREPLRMVSTYMTILEAKLKDKLTEEEKTFMRFAVDGSKRMDEMITRILNTAKGGQSTMKPVDLNKTIEQLKMNLSKLMAEKNAEVSFENLPVLMADDIQMLQVFQNLVTNAIKYNNSGKPQIKISCEKKNSSIEISVADNGVGIPEQAREKVFEMFSRVENESGADGTGIGLSTVKNIIEKMKGKIWIEGNEPRGSVFKIEFANNEIP